MNAKAALYLDDFKRHQDRPMAAVDPLLVAVVAALAALGLVMMTSASISGAERQFEAPLHYLGRQGAYLLSGLLLGALMFRLPLKIWQKLGPLLLIAGLVLLALVLVPGIGRTVNGSSRWLPLGLINLQVSELMKLVVVIYLAGYLTRHGERVRASFQGFLMPLLVLALLAVLLLAEPDFGATVVIATTALVMLLAAGVKLWQFAVLGLLASMAFAALAVTSPYRLQRLTAFLDPWADPFNSGFQLSQSLIAFGRGELTGVGLGASIQKLFYLPEAHTDFVFAVLAEELGFLGVAAVILLFGLFAWRALVIARRALERDQAFAGYLAYGIGFWIAFQAFVNMGVNMGLLPTKGLTLPLMSYGGSSLIVTCLALALLFRIDVDNRAAAGGGR